MSPQQPTGENSSARNRGVPPDPALSGTIAAAPDIVDGDVPQPWMAWLTTEHFNLETQRVATIGEANGRASVFLGTLSAGLIALGFQSTGGRSAGTTTFEVLVLSALVVLGSITFLRCIQIAIDDWDYAARIRKMRHVYRELLPGLASKMGDMTDAEQAVVMLRPRLAGLQPLLSVAGTICVVTAIVVGGDVGVLAYGLHATLPVAIIVGAVAGLVYVVVGVRFQRARWRGAEEARAASSPMP